MANELRIIYIRDLDRRLIPLKVVDIVKCDANIICESVALAIVMRSDNAMGRAVKRALRNIGGIPGNKLLTDVGYLVVGCDGLIGSPLPIVEFKPPEDYFAPRMPQGVRNESATINRDETGGWSEPPGV